MAELMKRKRLIEYLPRMMQNFSELKELLNAANNETDAVNVQAGRILDEAFIESCTEYGLRKYENLLHIIPADGESLETRRMRVMMRWFTPLPYTVRGLKEKLTELLGGEHNFSIWADFRNDYELILTVFSADESRLAELRYLLSVMIPENIVTIIVYEDVHEGGGYFGAVLQEATILEIKQR